MQLTSDGHHRMLVRGRRLVLPLGLIVLSLWLLVGCLYLPTGEYVHLTGSKKDFRSMPGYDAAQKPQVAGRFTRGRIEAFLGRPPYVSGNGRRVMYVIHSESGLWIEPLCFTISARRDEAFGLVLRYDEQGTLQSWKHFEAAGIHYPLNTNFPPAYLSESGVLDFANEVHSTPTSASGDLSISPAYPDPWMLEPTR